MAEERDGDAISPAQDGDGNASDAEATPVPQPPATAAPSTSKVTVMVKTKRVKSPTPYVAPVVPTVQKPDWKRKVVRVAKKRVRPESRGHKSNGGDDREGLETNATVDIEARQERISKQTRGPLVDEQGNVVEFSYLGSKDDFEAYADRYEAHLTPLNPNLQRAPSKGDVATVEDAVRGSSVDDSVSDTHGHLLIYQRMLQLRDEHALCNWTQHNEVWKKQQAYLAKRLNTHIDELVMSRNEEYREIVEERLLIERAIPILEKGLGDFWRTNLQIGSALTGLSMPVNKSGRGEPPEILHIGKPRAVHTEQNYQSRNNLTYPWKDSVYLADRRRQLRELLDAIDPHAPNISELQVVAHGLDLKGLKSMLETATSECGVEGDDSSGVDDDDMCLIDMQAKSGAQTDDQSTGRGPGLHVKTERIVLETQTGSCTRQCVVLHNTGTIALRYYFVQEERNGGIHTWNRTSSCFYFDPNERIILPGEHVEIPFHFKSTRSGIYTERWHIRTSPPLDPSQSLGPITLRGIATEGDLLQAKREATDLMLERRAPVTFIRRLVRDLVDMAPVCSELKLRKRGATLVPEDDSTERRFQRKNQGLNVHFHRDVVNALTALAKRVHDKSTYDQVREDERKSAGTSPSPVLSPGVDAQDEEAPDVNNGHPAFEWDLSLVSLEGMILRAEIVADEDAEAFMKELNELVEKLYIPVTEPVRDDVFMKTARLLCQLAEKIAITLDKKTQAQKDEQRNRDRAPSTDDVSSNDRQTDDHPLIVHAHVLDTVRQFADMIVQL